MTTGQQSDQQLLDHVLLADDRLLELTLNPLAAGTNQLDRFFFVFEVSLHGGFFVSRKGAEVAERLVFPQRSAPLREK
jgi:hypothetical protein